MLEKNKIAPQRASELTGSFRRWLRSSVRRNSRSCGWTTDGLELSHVRSLPGIAPLLEKYTAQVLVNSELRTIHRAYWHSSCAEGRELIALDVSLQKEPLLQNVARASQQVGRAQLKASSAADQRVVQRYLAAVERGEARAWHTIVFGLVLALSPCHCGKGCSITPRRR
jgi:urease accessory protein UreF